MAVTPAPCLTMCKKPRVPGFAGASLAATPEPEERALIVFVVRSLLCWSTASARAAAVLAFVARAVRHHQHAALAARGRALVGIAQLWRGQRHLHGIERSFVHRWKSCRRSGSSGMLRRGSGIQLQVICGDESPAQPPRDVVQHRRNKPDVRVRGYARWLEPRVQQLVHEYFQRHAILQAE